MEIKLENKDDGEVYSTKLEPKTCIHKFYRAGAFIKCRKCTMQWFDPEKKFPIENGKRDTK